ncbi:hypothetical protein ELQ39_11645 [Streptomyces sp. GB4-14]|uniref:hypothetical protein n=1 Tax=Streptomyces TaxID=1883 RepID=UPI001F5FA776|nr:hypothetical protein [Streptomyces sp. GB4-14]
MADERYRWLDAEAAERLLSGETPRAADPPAGDQAEQLAGVLRALSAPPPTAETELPGEAAALAAFRASRDARTGQADSAPHTGHGTGTGNADVGLIRLRAPRTGRTGTPGGARRPRTARLALAAALVAGMVGGTAVLAGTGLLRTPFDDSRSGPAGAATATHPQRPLISPPAQGATPDEGDRGDSVDGGRDGAEGGEDPDRTPEGSAHDGKTAHGARWKLVVSACRSWHQGRPVNGERRRALHEAAGGASRVAAYCRGVTAEDGAEDGTAGKGAGGGTHDAGTRLDGGEGEQRNTLPGQDKGRPDTDDDSGENKGDNGDGEGHGNGGGRGNSGSRTDDHPSKGQGSGNGNGKGNGNSQGKGNDEGNGNGKQD